MLQLYLDSEDKLGNYECEAKNELGTLKRTIDLINGTRPARPAHIVLRGVNSNTFDVDVGAKRPIKTSAMDVTGYRFEIIPKEEFEYNRGKWITARVVYKDFTDGLNISFYMDFESCKFICCNFMGFCCRCYIFGE